MWFTLLYSKLLMSNKGPDSSETMLIKGQTRGHKVSWMCYVNTFGGSAAFVYGWRWEVGSEKGVITDLRAFEIVVKPWMLIQ